MVNFNFQNSTKIIFGKDTEQQVGQETKLYCDHVLLVHYGEGHIKTSGLYDSVIQSMKNADVAVTELCGIKANPDVNLVREGITICRDKGIRFLLAMGGGSVIDTAKAIGAGVDYDGDVWDFFTEKANITSALPLGTVLTIPATGSESSNATIVTNPETHDKRAVSHEALRPVFSILNPELTYTLPAYQTAAGGVDILSHVIERYFTLERNVDLTDRLCEAVMQTVIKNIPIALREPKNYNARAEIMWAGNIAHNGLLGTGRVEDWGSHMIAHEISGLHDTTHGATLSIVMPQWMMYVYQNDVARFARFAERIWCVEPDYHSPEDMALEGIARMKEYFSNLDMPVSFGDAGITDAQINTMAKKCTAYGNVGAFKSLGYDDVKAIYEACL